MLNLTAQPKWGFGSVSQIDAVSWLHACRCQRLGAASASRSSARMETCDCFPVPDPARLLLLHACRMHLCLHHMSASTRVYGSGSVDRVHLLRHMVPQPSLLGVQIMIIITIMTITSVDITHATPCHDVGFCTAAQLPTGCAAGGGPGGGQLPQVFAEPAEHRLPDLLPQVRLHCCTWLLVHLRDADLFHAMGCMSSTPMTQSSCCLVAALPTPAWGTSWSNGSRCALVADCDCSFVLPTSLASLHGVHAKPLH